MRHAALHHQNAIKLLAGPVMMRSLNPPAVPFEALVLLMGRQSTCPSSIKIVAANRETPVGLGSCTSGWSGVDSDFSAADSTEIRDCGSCWRCHLEMIVSKAISV